MTPHPYQVVRDFEHALAEFCGSKYAVTTDSCTSALLLCLDYWFADCGRGEITIPARTYPSVPCSIIHAGGTVRFEDRDWKGIYQLKPLPVWDAAKRFHRDMYPFTDEFMCLSFHSKKHLPIGRGGCILTDDILAVEYLRRARFDGRHECALVDDPEFLLGRNCYMTPEQAARGLVLLSMAGDGFDDLVESPPYPDLSKMECYR
jgi:dTDP-4-amino-4,6-dideoxygalactose transaminase